MPSRNFFLFFSENKVDPVDYNDPKFQSTSNPRWVEAGLSQKVIDVLSAKGITHLTPVQAEAFDPVLAGRDVIGRSRTGTGKTLAFGMPSVTRLVDLAERKGLKDERGRMVRGRPVSMIVLCPTRELAKQVQEELAAICRPLGLYTEVFHGGVSYDPQVCIRVCVCVCVCVNDQLLFCKSEEVFFFGFHSRDRNNILNFLSIPSRSIINRHELLDKVSIS